MASQKVADWGFLRDVASKVAPLLLGCLLEREIDGKTVRVRIVETEAYDQTDLASHSYKGETPRSKVMFGPAGHLYVYFNYGMHYCCNVVIGEVGFGAAVLIRAVEPVNDMSTDAMRQYRPQATSNRNISNGPAKLCQALQINTDLNGHNLQNSPLRLLRAEPVPSAQIIQTQRIGISRAKEVPWRFYIKDNTFVSKP